MAHGLEPVVLVGGIDLQLFRRTADRESFRRALGVGSEEFLIFSPRLFRPLQNIDIIVRAMPRVLRALPNARLLIVKYLAEAYPAYERSVEQLIDALGVRASIRFVPTIANEEMPRYYTAADCTVSIPNTDGTPMTLMESAACETPSIIHDLPDYDPALFVHRETVLRVPLQDPERLADAVVTIATDGELRKKLVQGAHDVAERHANYEEEMLRLETLYQGLAHSRA
jgi:glycosyltransferase involved in cell wall biosynthesis